MRALHTLRARGYTLRESNGELLITGPQPKDPEAARKWFAEHKAELLAVLASEQHPVVAMALDVFPGAKVVRVGKTLRYRLYLRVNVVAPPQNSPENHASRQPRPARGPVAPRLPSSALARPHVSRH
jgi:hypothetical protein